MAGYYVSPTAEVLELHTVFSTDHPLVYRTTSISHAGTERLLVWGVDYFDSSEDAERAAVDVARDLIKSLEDRVETYLNQHTHRETPRKGPDSQKVRRGVFNRTQEVKETDPLGPPEYGVGKTVKHKKDVKLTGTIVGYRESNGKYVVNFGKLDIRDLDRDTLRQYEVVA